MKKKLLVLGLVMALLVALAGCASSSPAAGDAGSASPSSSEVPSQESVPEEPESEPAPEPEEETPAEKPASIYLYQETPTYAGFTLLWELTIEDEEEIALIEELLSIENLVPASEDEAMWPDGGTSIIFEINYEDHTVYGACNPRYVYPGDDYSNLWTEEVFYRYPKKTGDALMAFLESKGITVSG